MNADKSVVAPALNRPVSWIFLTLYMLALFGVWMAILTPANVTLALRIADFDPVGKTQSYSLVAGVGTVVALLANPFFGRLSDRTRSRFGMRRPWMIVGVLGGALGASFIALVDNFTAILLGWILMQLFLNASVAALLAVIADRIPAKQQGVASGIAGMTQAGSVVVGAYFVQVFPTDAVLQMAIPIASAAVAVTLFALVLDDRRLGDAPRPPLDLRELLQSFYFDPRTSWNFSWLLVSFGLIYTGAALLLTYTVYYVQDVLHIEGDGLTQAVFAAVLVNNGTAVVASLLAGYLAVRMLSYRLILMFSGVLIASGILLFLLIGSLSAFLIGNVVVGLGSGAYLGIYVSYATQIMPGGESNARNLGLVNIAYALSFALSPLLAPILLATGGGGNYGLLFVVGAVVTLIGVPMPLFLRHQPKRA